MRILTRYILGEILSHTLIGCALFTFILFMRDLHQILEMVVRNSSTFAECRRGLSLHASPTRSRSPFPWPCWSASCWGSAAWPPTAKSSPCAPRASGIGYFVRVASIVAIGGTLLGLVNSLYVAPRANQAILDMQQALETSQASYRDSAARLLRGFPQRRALRAERARRDRRVQLGPGLHGRRHRSRQPDHHHGRIGHRGQRFHAGTADAPARRCAARNGSRTAAAVQHLHFHQDRSAPHR